MPFDPNQSVRGSALGGFIRNPAVGSIGGNQSLLRQAQAAGYFDPMGSARLRALRRRRALQLHDIGLGRASTRGQLIGLDPMSQRQALIDAENAGNAGLSGFLNQSDFEDQQGNQDFFRNLYRGELDFQRQRQLQREAERAASRGAVGTALGAIGGRIVNKFLPI